MTETAGVTCIYPGCDREAVAPHPEGGPPPQYCDLEEHNASSAHQARESATSSGSGGDDDAESS